MWDWGLLPACGTGRGEFACLGKCWGTYAPHPVHVVCRLLSAHTPACGRPNANRRVFIICPCLTLTVMLQWLAW